MAIKFNKKSMSKITEPDRLDKYIRVATPSAWLVLAAVLLAIVCLVIWLMMGEVEGQTIYDALFGAS